MSTFDPGFRLAIVFISWVLLLLAPDGDGFFTTLTVICIPLVHSYSTFNPTNRQRKIVKNIVLGIVIVVSAIGVLGVLRVFQVSMRDDVAYVGLTDNIFFYREIYIGLRYVLLVTILLPVAAGIDWLSSFKL